MPMIMTMTMCETCQRPQERTRALRLDPSPCMYVYFDLGHSLNLIIVLRHGRYLGKL